MEEYPTTEADGKDSDTKQAQVNPVNFHDRDTFPKEFTAISKAGGSEFIIRTTGGKAGVYLYDSVKGKVIEKFLCSLLLVVALIRNRESKGWGRVLLFWDPDGTKHEHVLKASEVGRDGDVIISELRKGGVHVTAQKALHHKLIDYLLNTEPHHNKRLRTTDKTGWHGISLYVAQDKIFGNAEEEYIYDGDYHPFAVSGTLEEWQEHIGKLCVGNPLLIFCVSMAFASPLLYLLKEENGGFNLMGESSIGKTTAFKVAASVFGNPAETIQRWNATINAMEKIASSYNDILLILDEIGQASAYEIGNTVYMLGNGMGKGRMQASGELRKRNRFRCLFLSNGERTLEAHMGEVGRTVRAGQEVRLVDIIADMGAGYGIYNDIHDSKDSYDYNERILDATGNYYGTPMRLFLEKLVNDPMDALDTFGTDPDWFVKEYAPSEASGQVKRIAKRFGLIAAAGAMASHWGITGWDETETGQAVAIIFKRWLADRGTIGQSEELKLISQVRRYFEQYGESRFSPINAENKYKSVINRAGFVGHSDDKDKAYAVLPENFKEICSGYDPKRAVKILLDAGILQVQKDGLAYKSRRLPGYKHPKKVYVFTSKILEDVEPIENTEIEEPVIE